MKKYIGQLEAERDAALAEVARLKDERDASAEQHISAVEKWNAALARLKQDGLEANAIAQRAQVAAGKNKDALDAALARERRAKETAYRECAAQALRDYEAGLSAKCVYDALITQANALADGPKEGK
jgi:hypothetical protein